MQTFFFFPNAATTYNPIPSAEGITTRGWTQKSFRFVTEVVCFQSWVCWLTFVHDGDSFLRNVRARSPDRFGVQIKLVARAVLEVGQSDRGLIGGQGQLLHWAQLIGVIDYRGGGGRGGWRWSGKMNESAMRRGRGRRGWMDDGEKGGKKGGNKSNWSGGVWGFESGGWQKLIR